jgi:hypothetical protein
VECSTSSKTEKETADWAGASNVEAPGPTTIEREIDRHTDRERNFGWRWGTCIEGWRWWTWIDQILARCCWRWTPLRRERG